MADCVTKEELEARLEATETRLLGRLEASEMRLLERIEKSETTLLLEFHKWAQIAEMRIRTSEFSVSADGDAGDSRERLGAQIAERDYEDSAGSQHPNHWR